MSEHQTQANELYDGPKISFAGLLAAMRRSSVPTRVGIDVLFNVARRDSKQHITSVDLRQGPPAIVAQYSFYALNGLERCGAIRYDEERSLRHGSLGLYTPLHSLTRASQGLITCYRKVLAESLGGDSDRAARFVDAHTYSRTLAATRSPKVGYAIPSGSKAHQTSDPDCLLCPLLLQSHLLRRCSSVARAAVL